MNEKELLAIAQNKINETFKRSGKFPVPKTVENAVNLVKEKLNETVDKGKTLIKEAMIVIPRTFLLKTEYLSQRTKEAHESLYKSYVDSFNKVSSKLDTEPKTDDQTAGFRNLKLEETYNFNSIKLHELYFSNISDLSSEISIDSIPYMRLSRDWGAFQNWQFDFRATCLAAREGWGIVYYEPYKNRYCHALIDGHSQGVPIGCIPVLVIDMWSHSYYRDYLQDKKAYINSMMREINWNVIEARMVIAERSNLQNIYLIQPIVNSEPEKITAQSQSQEGAPIEQDQILSKELTYNNPNAPPVSGVQAGSAGVANGPSLVGTGGSGR